MSDEVKQLSFLDGLKQQHQGFIFQRDQAQVNLQQLIGAIYACEVMIKNHEEYDLNAQLEKESNEQKEEIQ